MADPPDDEMSHVDFLRAQFFSSEAEHAEHIARMARATPKPRRRVDPDIRALARFATVMDATDPAARRAAILWLVARYVTPLPPRVKDISR